jgi:uncharacterized protein HemY
MKGWALFAKQDYAEAIETLRLAIPNSAGAFTYLLLASALAQTGHPSEGHEALSGPTLASAQLNYRTCADRV